MIFEIRENDDMNITVLPCYLLCVLLELSFAAFALRSHEYLKEGRSRCCPCRCVHNFPGVASHGPACNFSLIDLWYFGWRTVCSTEKHARGFGMTEAGGYFDNWG